MDYFVIAQIFGVIGIIFSVLSMQMKTKKNIMIMFVFFLCWHRLQLIMQKATYIQPYATA